MDPPVKLPLELKEEILSRLPLESLFRFRTVSKHWKALVDSRARPQFIFLTDSYKVYSIDIIDLNRNEPKILKRELPSSNNIPCPPHSQVSTITTCDDFLFCNVRFKDNGTTIWNPWLRQVKRINLEARNFFVCGLGYDNTRPEKVYKILGHFLLFNSVKERHYQRVATYECASHAFKYLVTPNEDWPLKEEEDTRTHVSLNGNIYWATEYIIRSFDFSMDIFKTFCVLPCHKNHSNDAIVLAVFKGDRFSLLNHSYAARKIDIWVTKKKIDREEVEWIKLMALPKTNLPNLSQQIASTGISYYIYDQSVVISCGDETGVAYIYIVRGDMLKKIQIPRMYYPCCHCVYVPSLRGLPSEFR